MEKQKLGLQPKKPATSVHLRRQMALTVFINEQKFNQDNLIKTI